MTKPNVAAQSNAQMQLYGDGDRATPESRSSTATRAVERWPSVTVEVWLAKRLGDRSVFAGATTAEERRERIRQRIIADGRQDDVAGKRAADGVEETYSELFERLYGVLLGTDTDGGRPDTAPDRAGGRL